MNVNIMNKSVCIYEYEYIFIFRQTYPTATQIQDRDLLKRETDCPMTIAGRPYRPAALANPYTYIDIYIYMCIY